jgi:hypothetical protein
MPGGSSPGEETVKILIFPEQHRPVWRAVQVNPGYYAGFFVAIHDPRPDPAL